MQSPRLSRGTRAHSSALVARAVSCSLAASALWATLATSAADSAGSAAPDTLRKLVVTDSVEESYTVDSSESATPLTLSLRETPQSMTVITQQRIEDQKLDSLRDVLDNTPGVYSYAYDTERVLFTARGFTINNLMYDGVPATTNFSTGSIDETLDTALYERIEIVRGATGLMTGAGSPAAAVNLVRKHADGKDFGVNLTATMASWDDRRLEADLVTSLNADGSIRGRVIGVYQDRDSYQDLYSNERKVFYGIVDFDVGSNGLLSIGYDYQDNDPRSVTWGSFPLYLGDGTPANWSRSVTTAPDWSYWNRNKQSAFAEFRYNLGNDWSVRSTLTWRRFKEDLALFYVFGYPDPETGEGLDPYAYLSDSEITEKALDVHASGPISLFGREHEFAFGYNGSRVDNTGNEASPDSLAPVGNFFEWDGSYPEPTFGESTPVNDLETRQNGFYAAGRFVLADPLKMIAGLRYATWKSEGFYVYDGPEATSNYDYEKVIPYAGLIYDITQSFSLFGSYTEIFEPQGARSLSGSLLDPIEGRSYEVGIKGEHLDGRLNTALTLFETFQDNVATAAVDPETGEPILLPNGNQASVPVDGTETRGFELEISGLIREGWNASLGWSRYQTDDADGAAIRTFVPGTLVRGFTSWTPASLQKLTIGGGINWQKESTTFVGSPDGGALLEQSDVTLVSLMVRYQFTPNVSVQFNSDNLLDEKYYVLDEYDNTYFGTPANYSLSVSVRL